MSLTAVFNIKSNIPYYNPADATDYFKSWETVRGNIQRAAEEAKVEILFHEYTDTSITQPSLKLVFDSARKGRIPCSDVNWSILVEMPVSFVPVVEQLIYVDSVTLETGNTIRRKNQGVIQGLGPND